MTIPYDIYESSQEIIILLPLGGIQKESIRLRIDDYTLYLTASRHHKKLKEGTTLVKEMCYRGEIKTSIALPPHISFGNIVSELSKENILTVIIPKNIPGDHIPIHIEK